MDPNAGGVHAWMASVRASMDNDSSRKIFESQVQSHAFAFLDNYLEHILAGPKQGPIIDLVKTPGRRKNVPRRTRAAVAATTTTKITPLSLDDENSTHGVIPVNSFHKALLQAKERSALSALEPQKLPMDSLSASHSSTEEPHGRSKVVQVADIPEITVSIEPPPRTGSVLLQQDLSSEPTVHFPPSEHGAVLSVIAESDESPERGCATTLPLSGIPFNQDEPPQNVPPLAGTDDCVPLESPREAQQPSGLPAGNHTEPLFPMTAFLSPGNRERNAFTAPLPVVPVSNSIPTSHTFSVPLNDTPPRTLPYKGGAPGFPTLPAPSPLRKSMRVTQHAPVTQDVPIPSMPPTIPPALAPLGKRTSWLMKAREAKAMDGTGSLPGTSIFPRVPTTLKRKSGEMLGALPSGSDVDGDWRQPKVAKSAEIGIVSLLSQESERTAQRDIPPVQDDPIAMYFAATAIPIGHSEPHVMDIDKQVIHPGPTEDGFIDLFKRTVEGLGARVGKSMGKSLGGAAAAALAEARAAAEARVAERNKVSSEFDDPEVLHDSSLPDREILRTQAQRHDQISLAPVSLIEGSVRRLSVSDLAQDTAHLSEPELSALKNQATESSRNNGGDDSVSTTPPDLPLKGNSGFIKPAGPVFNKPPPPPVFMPPAPRQKGSIASEQPHLKESVSSFPSSQLALPTGMSLGASARTVAPSDGISSFAQGTSKVPVQSSQPNIFSDLTPDDRDGVLTQALSRQDIPYSTDPQQCDTQPAAVVMDDDDDDDDSWPLEEKLAAAEPGWRPFDFSNVDKEDTWSSLPTESQGATRRLTTEAHDDTIPLSSDADIQVGTENEEVGREQEAMVTPDVEPSMDTSGPDEAVEAEIGGLSSVDLEPGTRAVSQTSMASTTSSSQSQAGFFSQATKLVNSMLGGGKKTKPEVKSLQLAAAAAKRQQDEADKKTQRLKDMETRRQVAIAKKAEDERVRLLEEQKKSREEFEKRKREREENTDRRPLKLPVSSKKADDDAPKKRKLGIEAEKKQESKKPPTKDKKDLVLPAKLIVTPAAKSTTSKGAKATTAALVSSTAYNATQNPPSAKPFKVVPSSLKGKAKAKPQEDDTGDKLPSTMVQTQMAARAKAQMQAAKLELPASEIPSESIELPDINSEYSDSEDEDRVRAFDPPEWAQSPELRQALQMQSTVNPDDIFGGIRPLRMEEIFRTRQSRFRARTSSANWSGSDRLTVEEIREYERRMGFQHTRS